MVCAGMDEGKATGISTIGRDDARHGRDRSVQRIVDHGGSPRLRLVWVEEWMSTLAWELLPYLAQRHAITYVSAGTEIPKADFARVIRGKRWRYMNVAGLELSWYVNRLYRQGLIDLALVWGSIGFGLRGVPFINFEGTSVYASIRLFASLMPWHRRIRFAPGFAHYAIPEMLCDRRALKVVAPSETLRRDILRVHHLPDRKVVVIPHGVEERHLMLYTRKAWRDLRPRLVFVGRLHHWKGITAVLREFVRRRDIDAEFVIVGDGPDRAEIEAVVAGDGRVQVLGLVPPAEVQSILSTTNVFVFPTFYEGFGLALTEAMASGHACVCYDIPINRELLGDCGVYAPLGNAAALIDGVARLVKQPDVITACAERAHQKAAQFSWDQARVSLDRLICDTYLELTRGQSPVVLGRT